MSLLFTRGSLFGKRQPSQEMPYRESGRFNDVEETKTTGPYILGSKPAFSSETGARINDKARKRVENRQKMETETEQKDKLWTERSNLINQINELDIHALNDLTRRKRKAIVERVREIDKTLNNFLPTSPAEAKRINLAVKPIGELTKLIEENELRSANSFKETDPHFLDTLKSGIGQEKMDEHIQNIDDLKACEQALDSRYELLEMEELVNEINNLEGQDDQRVVYESLQRVLNRKLSSMIDEKEGKKYFVLVGLKRELLRAGKREVVEKIGEFLGERAADEERKKIGPIIQQLRAVPDSDVAQFIAEQRRRVDFYLADEKADKIPLAIRKEYFLLERALDIEEKIRRENFLPEEELKKMNYFDFNKLEENLLKVCVPEAPGNTSSDVYSNVLGHFFAQEIRENQEEYANLVRIEHLQKELKRAKQELELVQKIKEEAEEAAQDAVEMFRSAFLQRVGKVKPTDLLLEQRKILARIYTDQSSNYNIFEMEKDKAILNFINDVINSGRADKILEKKEQIKKAAAASRNLKESVTPPPFKVGGDILIDDDLEVEEVEEVEGVVNQTTTRGATTRAAVPGKIQRNVLDRERSTTVFSQDYVSRPSTVRDQATTIVGAPLNIETESGQTNPFKDEATTKIEAIPIQDDVGELTGDNDKATGVIPVTDTKRSPIHEQRTTALPAESIPVTSPAPNFTFETRHGSPVIQLEGMRRRSGQLGQQIDVLEQTLHAQKVVEGKIYKNFADIRTAIVKLGIKKQDAAARAEVLRRSLPSFEEMMREIGDVVKKQRELLSLYNEQIKNMEDQSDLRYGKSLSGKAVKWLSRLVGKDTKQYIVKDLKTRRKIILEQQSRMNGEISKLGLAKLKFFN